MRRWLHRHLWPSGAEKDLEFRAEIERLSRRGLYITGGVEIGLPLVGQVLARVLAGNPRPQLETLAFAILGILTILAARSPITKHFGRTFCFLTGALAMTIMSVSDLLTSPDSNEAAIRFALNVTTVLFVGVVAFPGLPLHSTALGLWSLVVLWATAWYGMRAGLMQAFPSPTYSLVWVILMTLMATVLSAVNYARLAAMFENHRQHLEDQSRLLLSENSAALAKFAAAMNHEMNSPLGALMSAVQTMPALLERFEKAPAERRDALRRTASDLGQTASESAARLSDIVARMRRLTNLDRADVQSVDLNNLLRDHAAMLQPDQGKKIRLQLELEDLPAIVCRPQQMSAVFGTLLHEAADASPQDGVIVVSTRAGASSVEVAVRDFGPSISAEEAAQLLSPRFTVAANRVAGNWNLFTSRQIVSGHGGDMRINGHQEGGKTVTVLLRIQSELKLAS